MSALQEAHDAERRAFRRLQSCPAGERTFRAHQLSEARKVLRVAQARAALEAPAQTETERRVAELERRRAGRAA